MCTLHVIPDCKSEFDVSTFPRILTSAAELSILGIGLGLAMILSPFLTVPLSLVLMLVGVFAAITGKGVWRLRGRTRGVIVFLVAGIFAVAASQVHIKQREARWAELRQTDPDAYLTELATIDDARWLAELHLLRPEQYGIEISRREAKAESQRQAAAEEAAHRAEAERQADEERATQQQAQEAERAEAERVAAEKRTREAEAARLNACTDEKAGEAFVMIQADVRRSLIAPSTANFPARYGTGTGHIGDCLYRVNGYFDAQNGFGAMLRGTFSGTTRYFPENGSWQTQSLSID